MEITYKELSKIFDSKSLVTLRNNLVGQYRHIDNNSCILTTDAIIAIVNRAKKEGVINLANAAKQLGLGMPKMRDLVLENKLTYFGFGNNNPRILFFAETFNSEIKGVANIYTIQSYHSIQDLKFQSKRIMNIVAQEKLIGERLVEIISLYDDGYSLSQIGEQYGITTERARQLIEKAKQKVQAIVVNSLTNFASANDNFFYVDNLERENKRLKEMLTTEQIDERELVHIDDLDLSIRLYNVLNSQRLHTIKDIKGFLQKGGNFKRLRNFGTKSMNELKEVMAKHGVSI
jgi:hypothetical protein